MKKLIFLSLGISVLAFLLGSCAPASSKNSGPVAYTYSTHAVTYPDALAVDSSGYVWVLGQEGDLAAFAPNGTITTFSLPLYSSSTSYAGIAIDSAGYLWAVDYGDGYVVEFDTVTGHVISPSYPTGYYPYGVAIDANDTVWVGDNGTYASPPYSSSVTEIPLTGPSQSFSQGNSLGSNCPESVAIDNAGYVWLSGCGHVYLFDSLSGAYTTDVFDFPSGGPGSIAIDQSNNAWVVDLDTVYLLNPPNNPATMYAHSGSTFQGIAIDSAGDVWVTDSANAALLEISPSGVLLNVYTVGNNPGGVAIDSAGDVWVANTGDGTVTEWMGVATGPQYFPYAGPEFPAGQP